MRVLQVVTHMNRGGLETMIINYYRNIDRGQVQFDFLVHRLERADYDDEIEALGGKIYRLPILNPFSITYKKALNEFFEQHPEYQVIHVHQDCMSSVILKEAKKHGVYVRIAHSHSSNQDKNLKYLLKKVYRKKIPKYATDLMACGDEAGRWMFCGASFQVLNNAIDAKKYTFDATKRKIMREKLDIAPETLLIGHVGRFSPPKNQAFLIDVFYKLQEKMDAKLLLVGEGFLRNEMEEKVSALGLTQKVIFTGIRSDVSDLMQAMDIFVFPSIYEGLPVTLIEAQASGLPCLISHRVPIECKKTDLVQQIPLDAGVNAWVYGILQATKLTRRDRYEEIRESGFDIQENARRLQEYYLKSLAREDNVCLY